MKTKLWGAVGSVVAILLSLPAQAATIFIDALPGGQYQSAPGPCYGCFGLTEFTSTVFSVSPGDTVQFGTVLEHTLMGFPNNDQPGPVYYAPFIIGLASVSFDPATPPSIPGGWWDFVGNCATTDTACITRLSAVQQLIVLTFVVPDGANTIQVAWAGAGTYDPAIPPIPIPPSFILFGTGLGALGLLGWRRKRKNAAAIAA